MNCLFEVKFRTMHLEKISLTHSCLTLLPNIWNIFVSVFFSFVVGSWIKCNVANYQQIKRLRLVSKSLPLKWTHLLRELQSCSHSHAKKSLWLFNQSQCNQTAKDVCQTGMQEVPFFKKLCCDLIHDHPDPGQTLSWNNPACFIFFL